MLKSGNRPYLKWTTWSFCEIFFGRHYYNNNVKNKLAILPLPSKVVARSLFKKNKIEGIHYSLRILLTLLFYLYCRLRQTLLFYIGCYDKLGLVSCYIKFFINLFICSRAYMYIQMYAWIYNTFSSILLKKFEESWEQAKIISLCWGKLDVKKAFTSKLDKLSGILNCKSKMFLLHWVWLFEGRELALIEHVLKRWISL